jgi:pyruvate dehydrogenase E2 component (dihydrolipoamide acetyltransferase)
MTIANMVEVVRIPKLGLSDYGDLVSWEVDKDDHVTEGEVVAVLESDKASAEIEAPSSGVLLGRYVEEGEEIAIEVGKPLAVIGEEGESVPSLSGLEDEGDVEGTGEDATEAGGESAVTEIDEANGEATATTDVKAMPRAKRRAEEEDVDLTQIDGTGPQGAITESDVEEFVSSAGDDSIEEPTAASSETEASELTVTESRELTGTRKTIAERLSESAREKPHVMGTRDIGIERLEEVRGRLVEEKSVDVSLNDLILHVVGRTLEDRPEFNAHFEDDEHRLIDEINVGYAVDSERGLMVPVIEDVPNRNLDELAAERRQLVEAVLEDEHAPSDLQGGTFTVTNVGVFDMDVSYSIINPPQVAILALGRRKQIPVERDGDVEFERAITFSLTIDHRVLDGADSGAFLDRLAEYLEYPGRAFDAV